MLARIALRMATIAALKDKTLVGDNVLDSEITALDADADGNLKTDQQKPFVTVYTSNGADEGSGDRSLHRSGRTELVIEIAVAATMVFRDENNDKVIAAGIPATDAALEFYLDAVGRQIVNALTDPNDAWAEIWRGLSSKVVKVERKRTSDAEGGRIAAHQLVITLDLMPDPVFGEPLAETSIWRRFFDKLDEPTVPNPNYDSESASDEPELIVDPVLAAKTTLLRSLIGEPGGTMAAAQQRRFGMTLDEVRALLNVSAVEGSEPDIAGVEFEAGQ